MWINVVVAAQIVFDIGALFCIGQLLRAVKAHNKALASHNDSFRIIAGDIYARR